MAESLFDLFGDHLTRQAARNVSRQPLFNNENHGKTIAEGPVKPNEPKKKAMEGKKSFMVNKGKALQSTSARQMFSPRVVNIYVEDKGREELEFTKPTRKNETHCELFDPFVSGAQQVSPPATPSPQVRRHSMEFDCSVSDDFLDYSIDSLQEDDLGLPALY